MTAGTGWHLYRSYKSGTKHVVQRLANATRQRCNIIEIMPKLCEGPSETPRPSKPKESAIALSTSDLLTLAKALLAESSSTLPPPDGIDDVILVIATAISGRQECASWYQQDGLPHN